MVSKKKIDVSYLTMVDNILELFQNTVKYVNYNDDYFTLMWAYTSNVQALSLVVRLKARVSND